MTSSFPPLGVVNTTYFPESCRLLRNKLSISSRFHRKGGHSDSERYEIRQATLADIPELIRMQMALQRDMDGIRTNLLRPNRTNIAGLREYYHAQIQDEHTRLLVAGVAESPRAVGMWKRMGFEPVLITAAADREGAERALGIPARQGVPRAYRTVLAGKSPVHMISAPTV